jgi:hypothetical protein
VLCARDLQDEPKDRRGDADPHEHGHELRCHRCHLLSSPLEPEVL